MLPASKLPAKDWPHLQELQLADPNYHSPGKIDLILGADLYSRILLDGYVRGAADAPIAQKTVFGWILTGIVGPPDPASDSSQVTAFHIVTQPSISQSLTRFWEIEEIPTSNKLSPEEEYCVQYFASTTYRNSEGRFVVRLPFARREPFPDSRGIAVACLRRSEKRRSRDPALQAAYVDFMAEYAQLGHMKIAPDPPASDFHFYLPHHGVFRSASKKIRVVFNASQKTASGYSLNDVLLPGPKMQPDITLVVIRWRFYFIAVVTDIVKMFRQFLVHKDDLDWQRLVWEDPIEKITRDYVALTVTYGTTSAPFLAMSALLQLAKEEKSSHPLAYRIIKDLTYIDDIFFGADDTEQAVEIRNQLIDLLATAGMQLGKWSSSSPKLLQGLPGVEVCDLPSQAEDVVSTLGLKWDAKADEFLFTTTLPPLAPFISKRSVLSDVARLFDPLGFISPSLIQAKILLQDLWLNRLDWDVPLPGELLERWLKFRSSLLHLPEIRIPRWIGTSSNSSWHLHGFADASMRAYAAVLFAVVPGSTPRMLIAKTRVAPVKVETLPRLELCAALLLTNLAMHLISGLFQAPQSINFWSDSKVVLDWLRSHPSRWPTFVANRVSKINSSFPEADWRHVGSKDNPADCATRGMEPQELARFSLWWHGPAWLPRTSEWPAQPKQPQVLIAAEANNDAVDEDVLSSLKKFSSFSKTIRVLAYILPWRSKVKRGNALSAREIHEQKLKSRPISGPILSAEEIRESKLKLFKLIQLDFFSTEISCASAGRVIPRRSPLSRLAPFLDEQGVLRVGGRLHNAALPPSERHPIILPARCHFVHLLVQETHRITLHGGVQLMKSVLLRSYWIIRGNRLFSKVYRLCVKCIRFGASPLQQQMAPLPAARVQSGRPFAVTGLDYAGPFPVLFSKGRGAKSTKGYIAIFICLVTKAVHIEVVSDLTSDSFLAAFSRFTARRGLCHTIFSDNGTTFKGADAELKRLFEQSSPFSKEIFEQLSTRGIEWKFIPPRAPHFGGLWEAAVRSFKHHFRRVIGGATLTFEELSTLAAKIEACLNSRPLCPVSSEALDPVALTPGHFIVGEALLALPEPMQDLNSKITLRSRWQFLSRLRDSFWVRWRQEVLSQLQQRNKWLNPDDDLQAGDLVIVTDELSPPAAWPLAIVSQVHPGDDKHVRVVTLRTAKSSFIRPIVKLIRLPPDEEAVAHYHTIVLQDDVSKPEDRRRV